MKNLILPLLFIVSFNVSAQSCPKVMVVNAKTLVQASPSSESWHMKPFKNFEASLKKQGYVIVSNIAEADFLASQKFGKKSLDQSGRMHRQLVVQLTDARSELVVKEQVVDISENSMEGVIFPRAELKATRQAVANFSGCL